MTPNQKHKDFDAVKMMREIRDKIDHDIANMTFAEQKAYLQKATDSAKRPTQKEPARN